jgi:hypothetical protein
VLVSEAEWSLNAFIPSRFTLHFSSIQIHCLNRVDNKVQILFVAVRRIVLVWVVVLTIQDLTIEWHIKNLCGIMTTPLNSGC